MWTLVLYFSEIRKGLNHYLLLQELQAYIDLLYNLSLHMRLEIGYQLSNSNKSNQIRPGISINLIKLIHTIHKNYVLMT